MAEIYLMVSLTEGDGETISLVEVIGKHTPDLSRDSKAQMAENILSSMVYRVIDRYEAMMLRDAMARAQEVAKSV